jgi:signal transduction histidine kinase/putative methionine-R-sulfoxide reductase with GAF domain
MEKMFTPVAMASLLDNLAEGIVITNSDGAVQYINQAALDLLGLSQQPAGLYDVVAPYETWRELLEADASVHLYRESGRVDVRTRPVTWNDQPAWQLMFTGRRQTGAETSGWSQPADHLAAISRISQQLNVTLSLPNVLTAIVQEAVEGTGATGGEISLYDMSRGRFVPHIIQGEVAELPDDRQAEMARLRLVQIVRLIGPDQPQIQLAAPILYEGLAAGLLRLYHPETDAFDEGTRLFISTLAHQAAIAMGNARRFEELNKRNTQLHRRARQIERFVESSRVLHHEFDLDHVFEDLVYAIQEGVGFRIVALNLIDEDDPAMTLRTVTAAGMPLDRLAELKQITQPWRAIQTVFRPELAIGSAYFIPGESSESFSELATYEVSDLYLPADQSQAEPVYRVVCVEEDGVLEVYDGPGTEHEHVATLANNTTGIYITGPGQKSSNGYWVPIVQKQTRGWVNERFLQEDTEPAALWEGDDLFFIPLYGATGDPIGLISLDSPIDGRRPDINVAKVLEIFANQAAAAIENARLFLAIQQQVIELQTVNEVSRAISTIMDLDKLLEAVGASLASAYRVENYYVALYNQVDDTLVFPLMVDETSAGRRVGPLPADRGPTNHIFRAGEPLLIRQKSEWEQYDFGMYGIYSESYLGVPMRAGDRVIGVLAVQDYQQPARFARKDINTLNTIAGQAAVAIENARLFAELRELNEQLDVRVSERTQALGQERDRGQYLLRVTTELSASLDQDRVLNRALELLNEVVHATQGAILLIDQERGRLIYRAAFGTSIRLPPDGFELALRPNEGLAGWIIKNRAAAIVHDTRDDERWLTRPDSPDHRSVLAVPLESGEEVIGVLMLFHGDPGAFSQAQLELVEAAAIQVASAISNAQLYLLIRDQAERLGTMLRVEQIEAAKNQAILESIADGVLVADASGRVILANLPASLILDIPRQELLGKYVKELLGLYGSSADHLAQTFDQWSRRSDTRQRALLADRLAIEDKFVSVHLSPVFAGSQFFGTVSIFRDVTQDVEVDRMKSEFVSTVSHELRTPMTSVKGYADLMLLGAAGPMTGQQTHYLTVIKNNADRLSLLVNDLLDISRIETGRTELDLQSVDVGQLIEQVVEGHLRGRMEHDEKPITIKTEVASGLPLVRADFAKATQILTNLLDNAFHYTPAGGSITVSARPNSNFVYVSVSDTGIGISRNIQQKIFDRFFRADDFEVQRVPGTGLGLAIVRSLVEMHGGQIEVFSIPGQGSTFTFNLPLAAGNKDEA